MNTASYHKLISYVVLAVVVSIPFLFGAVHPVVSGAYVFVILTVLGSWLLLTPDIASGGSRFSPWLLIPVLFIAMLALQAIPLPLGLLDVLSPQRGERLHTLNALAETSLRFASLSEGGPRGLHMAIFYLAILLYCLALVRLLDKVPAFQNQLLYCLVAIGSAEALYGLLQLLNPQIGILWLPNPERAAHGTIIYKNQYASLLNMIWPLALGIAFNDYAGRKIRKTKRKRKFVEKVNELSNVPLRTPLLLGGGIVMLLAVLFSLSRGGILSMVVAIFALMLFLPLSTPRKVGASLTLAALLCGYGWLLGFETIFARFGSLDQSGTHRLSIYLHSLPMLMDHWLTGIGMGSYALLSPIYLKGFPLGTLYDSAHNEYLELAIELGIPFALILFAWLFAGIVSLTRGVLLLGNQPSVEPQRQVIAIASLAGLIALLVHGSVDFGWRLPANTLYGATLLALCLHGLQPPAEPETAAREG